MLLLLVLGSPIGCARGGSGAEASSPPAPSLVSISDGWLAMGTFFEAELRVAQGEALRAREWIEDARREITRLEEIFSRHDIGSELSRLNARLARVSADRSPSQISPELAALLERTLTLSRVTRGAFDPTIGPLVELWTRAALADRWPAEDALRRASERVGAGRLSVIDGARLVIEGSPCTIDLDAISKGEVLDRLRDDLVERLPEASGLLSFGQSSVWAIGDAEGTAGGWRLEVRSRALGHGSLGLIELRDQALSVSSSMGQTSRIAGRLVSHVIDPRSGVPIADRVEAIVVAPRASSADAWSTALLVLGGSTEASGAVAGAGLSAIVFDSTGTATPSAGWDGEGSVEAPWRIDFEASRGRR